MEASDVICISSEDECNEEIQPRKVTKNKEPTWTPIRKLNKSLSGKLTKNGVNELNATKHVDTSKEEKSNESFKSNGAINGCSEPNISECPIFKTGEISISKRLSQSNDDKETPLAKRMKLSDNSIDENESRTNNNNSSKTVERSSPTPGCSSWFSEVEKPKLIIKEKKVLYDDEFDLFSTFIETCLKRDSSNDMKEIVKKLKKRHERLNPSILNSDRFKQLLIDKQKLIDLNDEKLFSHIGEVNDEMKSAAKRNRSFEEKDWKSVADREEKPDVKAENERKDPSLNTAEERRKRRNIKFILNRIEVCKKRIKQLEEEDVDLNDDDSSSYLKEDRYKRKLMQLWNAYCKYSGETVDAGRIYLRPKHISATMIPQVDNAIMNFINSKINRRNELLKKGKSIADTVIFPDYIDILNCISECNDKKNLGLNKSQQEIKAKEAFIKIGEHLQRVRQRDYWDTFSLFLEGEDDDPALRDQNLAEKLNKNKVEGKRKMNNLFEEFSKKQENRAAEHCSEETEDNADEKDDDNDEDDDNGEDDDDDDDEGEIEAEIDESMDKIDETENKNEVDKDEIEKEKKSEDSNEGKIIDNVDKNHAISKVNETKDNDKSEDTQNLSTKENTSLPQNTSFEAKDSSDADVIDVDEESSVADKQPVLRLRSFAKPPTSWKDSQAEGPPQMKKVVALTAKVSPTCPQIIRKFVTSTPKAKYVMSAPKASVSKLSPAVVDLTSEKKDDSPSKTPKKPLDPATMAAIKNKFKAVVLPPNFKGKQIISVKNITNNYNVVNGSGSGEMIPARVLTSVSHKMPDGSQTIIRIPAQNPSHLKPRSPLQMRVNQVPEKVTNLPILPKPVMNKQIFYQSTPNSKIINPVGKIVRVKTVGPNSDAKMMKVLNLNETKKVSITTLQKHRMTHKIALKPNSNQVNDQSQSKQILTHPRVDHQYTKKIVNNVIRIMKPSEQIHQTIEPNKLVKKT